MGLHVRGRLETRGIDYVRADASIHEVKDLSVATLRRQIAESRALLGSRLQLYQIHSATVESGVLDDIAVLRELHRLRSGGLVIGLTVTGPKQAEVIRRALRTNVDGRNPFQVVQATWNLLEVSAGPAHEPSRRGSAPSSPCGGAPAPRTASPSP